MIAYADTGFLVSLYLPENTSASAHAAIAGRTEPLPIISLTVLELRNALNLAIVRKRLTLAERDALWLKFESQIRAGIYEEKVISPADLHSKARALSDAYTPIHAARSLDLLHVAAALLLGAGELLSFDERQRKVAASEGLTVLP